MYKKKFADIKLFSCVILVLLLIFIPIIIFNKSILIFPGDSWEQMYPIYLGNWQRMHDLVFSGFEWGLGLGANYFSYIYYGLTSPFFLLSLLLKKDLLKYTFLYFNIIKMLCLFITTYFWSRKLTKLRTSNWIASFCITFSGWVLFYFAYNQFLDSFIFYPLILMNVESYLQKGKIRGLCFSIAFLGIINYYFLYLFMPFLFIYTLIRYLILHQSHLKVKDIFKDGLKFTAWVFLGLGMSGVVLLPCASLIIQNSRFSEEVNFFSHIGFKELYKIIATVFLPVFSRLDASFLVHSSFHDFLGWGGGCSLYLLILMPLIAPLVGFLKDKYKRNLYFGTCIVLLIFLVFKGFYILFQRTIDTRWLYMFNFIHVMIMMEVNKELEEGKIERHKLLVTSLITSIVLLLYLGISIFNKWNSHTETIKLILVSIFILILLWCYYFYYFKRSKDIYLLLLLSIESIFSGWIFLYYNKPINAEFFECPQHASYNSDWVKEHDNGFYRILYGKEYVYLPNSDSQLDITINNEPFSKRYKGFSFYSSVYNYENKDYIDRFLSRWSMSQAEGHHHSYNLLSAKYWITYSHLTDVPYAYKKLYTDPELGYEIYENPYFLELGFSYDKTINSEFLRNLPYLEQDFLMENYLATDSSNNVSVSETFPLVQIGTLLNEEVRVLELDNPISNGLIYIENAGVPVVTISLYNNDELIHKKTYWQFNYVDIEINEDDKVNRIVVEGTDEYDTGVMMRVFFEPDDGSYQTWYESKVKESFYDVNVINDDHIRAKIDISDKDKYVFTSIPYDKGWKVYVNGQRISTEKVQLGFIGFQLTPGSYLVEFRYEIPFLKIGALISMISSILLIILTRRKP